MHWNGKDSTVFQAQKEYIDTAVIPLIQIDGSDEGFRFAASAAEFTLSLANVIENQFKGRIVLFPSFSYTKSQDKQSIFETWQEELNKASFKHIFYVTSDRDWSTMGEEQNIIWIPSIPLDSMDQKMRNSVLEYQLRQLIPIFAKIWAN
ncbi:YpiF family protein [Psychrobacillus psychrotolerans]|uniref:YpiF family protein n=1 Tax=Psychrobacillus psychrotolerans TaxID=126156 RepID=UPI003315B391